MIKSLKKAFTIIELVIVIAVIAILAAVMIPTYSSLVKKANQSADIQAVKQMNTILALDEVDSNKSIADVHRALKAEGLDSENFTPLVSDTYFYWIKEKNRIVYLDNEENVIYPEDLKGVSLVNYCSLNGVIKVSDGNKISPSLDGEVEISNAEQLYYLSETMPNDLTTIKFSVSEIDARGAEIGFAFIENKKVSITSTAENGTIIKNAVSLKKHYTVDKKHYGIGFVAYVGKGVSLEISGITIEGGTFGDLEVGGVGALIGRIEHDENIRNIKITNCKVQKAIINGKNKVGALVGSIGKSNVTISNCKVNRCTVNCSEGESGKAIGCVYNGLTITIDNEFSKWVENTTLNLIATDKREVYSSDNLSITDNGNTLIDISNCEKIVLKVDKGIVQENKYRMFASEACMTVLCNSDEGKIIVANVTTGTSDLLGNNSNAMLNDSVKIDINILKFFK